MLAWSQLSDETLARRAAAGNEAAFTALYERYHGPLLGYCRSILLDNEDADDATQNALENALRALPARDAGRPLRPWLYRIAHNEAVSILRRRHSHDELGPDTEPSVSGPEVFAEQRGRLEQLVEDLRSLPERQRGALVMRELNGLSYEEIGGVLGLSEANARRAVFDARSALHDVAGGRDTDCMVIRRTLSDGDRRSVRSRRIRAHLRSCDQCRTFQNGIRIRRVELPAIAPWLGGAAAAGALGIGSGAAGGGGALIAAGGGGFGWTALPAIAKSMAVAAVVATTGTAATIELNHSSQADRPATRAQHVVRPGAAVSARHAQLSAVAAAAAVTADALARRARRADAAAQRRNAAGQVALTTHHPDGQTLQAPRPSVAKQTPPASATKPPVKPLPRPSVPRPSSGATISGGAAAAQKLQQIQAQVQAAIAKAQAAAASGSPWALQNAGALVAGTINSVQAMIGNVLSSVGLSVPSSIATVTPSSSATGVTAPIQQVLGGINGLLDQLLGHQ